MFDEDALDALVPCSQSRQKVFLFLRFQGRRQDFTAAYEVDSPVRKKFEADEKLHAQQTKLQLQPF